MSTKALTTSRRTSAGRLAKKSPNVSNAHLHVDMSDCLAAIPDMDPVEYRGYVAERPAQRSLVGQSLKKTTQPTSLVTMEEHT